MGERKAMEKSIPHLFTIYLENQTKKDGKRQSYEGSSRKAHNRSQTLGGERKKKGKEDIRRKKNPNTHNLYVFATQTPLSSTT